MKLIIALLIATIPGWLTYTDPINKFTINYPKEWTQKTVGNAVAFLSPREGDNDQFQENVNLILQDLSAQPMTLDQYTELSKKQIIDAYGANAILSQGTKVVGGQNAVQLIYNMKYQGRPLKIKQFWFIKNKTAYLFTFTAAPDTFAKYEETGTSIINSFTFQ